MVALAGAAFGGPVMAAHDFMWEYLDYPKKGS